MSKDLVIQMLQCKPIAYRSDFAKITDSVTAGVMLSQLFYWDGKSTKHGDGWVEKTQEEMYEETGLSDKQQRTAKFILEKHNFIESGRKGDRGRLCYRVNFDEVFNALTKHYSDRQKGSSEDQIGKKAELHRHNGTSKIGEKAVLSLQRVQTESTTEKGQNSDELLPLMPEPVNTRKKKKEKPIAVKPPPSLITEIKDIFEKGYMKLTGKKLSWAGGKAKMYQRFVTDIAAHAIDVQPDKPLEEVRQRARVLLTRIREENRSGGKFKFYSGMGFTPQTLYTQWNKLADIVKGSTTDVTPNDIPIEANLPDDCKQFMPYLVFKYREDNIIYYDTTETLSASFVEEKFAKAGFKIRLLNNGKKQIT